jgi:hypothetical protein
MSVYFIADNGLSKRDRQWLDLHTIKIGKGGWIHNNNLEGRRVVSFKVDKLSLDDLRDVLTEEISTILLRIEGELMVGIPKGRRVPLVKNILHMCLSVSPHLDQVSYAKDLLKILKSTIKTDPHKETTERQSPLGMDKETSAAYILKLAKGDTIH